MRTSTDIFFEPYAETINRLCIDSRRVSKLGGFLHFSQFSDSFITLLEQQSNFLSAPLKMDHPSTAR
jgi:hypothetical protein